MDRRDERIAELERLLRDALAQIAALKAENAELRARLGQNSKNSSKPPSSDPPGTEGKSSEPTGERPGGQPGHKGSQRELIPQEHVAEFVTVSAPKTCTRCRGTLLQVEGGVGRVHQVVELPKLAPHVTQYDFQSGYCGGCGEWATAPLPAGVPEGCFGPRLLAFVALCTGKFRLSKRMVLALLEDVLGVDIALGSVCNAEQLVSEALSAPVEEARAYVQAQDVVHQDETGWFEKHARSWLWVASTAAVAVFLVVKSRGKAVAKQMLGGSFSGVLISDRWCAYNWLQAVRRQICWAHLQREFEGFIERGGSARTMGNLLMAHVSVMLDWWHRVRDGTLRRATFQKKMLPLMREVDRLLARGEACANAKVAGTCREILKLRDSLWTFVYVAGVEPTNNRAEQDLRHAVIWRKTSFGTQSESGSRFVERILTVVMSLRKQNRNVLEYLTAATEAQLARRARPSLLQATRHAVTLHAA